LRRCLGCRGHFLNNIWLPLPFHWLNRLTVFLLEREQLLGLSAAAEVHKLTESLSLNKARRRLLGWLPVCRGMPASPQKNNEYLEFVKKRRNSPSWPVHRQIKGTPLG